MTLGPRHALRSGLALRSGVSVAALGLAGIIAAGPVAAGGWEAIVRQTRDGDSSVTSYQSMAASAGRVHLILERDGVEYRRSLDRGATWQRGIAIARNSASREALPLAVASAGDLVVVLFRTRAERGGPDVNRLWIRRSTDGGGTWQQPQLVDEYRHRERMGYGGAAVTGGTVHVAWTDRVTGSIWYRRGRDQAATFGAKRRIGVTSFTFDSGAGPQTDGIVDIAAAGRYVHVAWLRENEPGTDATAARGVAIRSSADGGSSFRQRRNVDRRPVTFFPSPTLASTGPRVLVLYELANNGRLIVARSSDGGASFARTVIMDPEEDRFDGWRRTGDIAISGRRAVVLLHLEDTLFVPEFHQRTRLAIQRSSDGGRTWGDRSIVVGARPQNKSFGFLNAVVGRSFTVLAFNAWRVDPEDETRVLGDVYTRTGP